MQAKMESNRQQLIDSLTAHISLYNSKSKSTPAISSTSPNPRSSILKWFRSLAPHQRQSHLTIVDHTFTRLLLQMQSKIQSHGHSLFIVLPDIPNLDHHPPLPSLCHRRSRGLLRRVADSDRSISESIMLFSSKEGGSFSEGGGYLDCVTVGRDFVENVDSFLEPMDEVTGGGFLRGEESGGGLGSDWVELDWLKGMGYYSLEAFVANRLEVALRLAWLNCNNGKKRGGVKLKEKVGLAGLAANVYWRKKGCVDWWGKLDGEMRHKIFRTVLGKAAKSLTAEILNRENCGLEDECGISNGVEPTRSNHIRCHRRSILALSPNTELWSNLKPHSANEDLRILAHRFKSLIVLQGISMELLACQCRDYDEERLFFSSLGSVGTISDCILRKLRSLLMVVALDCTRLELLDEGTSSRSLKKDPEKLVSGSRKKKGKVHNRKRLLPAPRSSEDDPSLDKLAEDCGDKSLQYCNLDMIHSGRSASTCQEKDLEIETPVSTVDMVVLVF